MDSFKESLEYIHPSTHAARLYGNGLLLVCANVRRRGRALGLPYTGLSGLEHWEQRGRN